MTYLVKRKTSTKKNKNLSETRPNLRDRYHFGAKAFQIDSLTGPIYVSVIFSAQPKYRTQFGALNHR